MHFYGLDSHLKTFTVSHSFVALQQSALQSLLLPNQMLTRHVSHKHSVQRVLVSSRAELPYRLSVEYDLLFIALAL